MSDPAPLSIDDHPHAHDRFCGHPVIPHDDHLDFLHDGEVHHVMGGELAATADSTGLHVVHVGHMHVHGAECGHPSVLHDDHLDYLHGDHRHASHGSHYDEH